MDKFIFQPKGVCSSQMVFEINDDKIKHVDVIGGCSGNLRGICNLLQNKTIKEVVEAFDGVTCGSKATSCPDQIAKALKEYQKAHA